MSNEQKTRTLIEDLPVTEQEMTTEEMENVQGGKTYFESRSNTTIAPKEPPPNPTKTQTPLPPAPGKTQTPL